MSGWFAGAHADMVKHTLLLVYSPVGRLLDPGDEWSERPRVRGLARLTDKAIDSGSGFLFHTHTVALTHTNAHPPPICDVTMLLFKPLNRPDVD